MGLVELHGLHKRFGETTALRDFTLSLDAGSVHVILGENGSGKSTAVKVMAGVIRPDAGYVEIGGHRIQRYAPREVAELGVAAVMQEVLVAPTMTVLENLFMGYDAALRRRIARRDRRPAAHAVLGRLAQDLRVHLDTPIGTLPLAAQQVVVICRALLRNPRVLVLDESTSALDVATRDALFTEVRQLTSAGKLVVFISHRMDEVMELGDHVTVMRGGTAVASVPRSAMSIERLFQLMIDQQVAGLGL